MAKMRGGKVVMGVGLVVMGYAVLIIGFAREMERVTQSVPTAAHACTDDKATSESASRVRSEAIATGTGLGGNTTGTGATGTGAASGSGTAGTGAPSNGAGNGDMINADAASGSSNSDGDVPLDDGHLFKFNPGGAGMGRDEVLRLLAAGKIWAKNPVLRVTIEGFGDLPGGDPLTVGIAKHRAKVGQTLLGKAGIPEDRITLTFSDTGPDSRLARSIRITTVPPVAEVETP